MNADWLISGVTAAEAHQYSWPFARQQRHMFANLLPHEAVRMIHDSFEAMADLTPIQSERVGQAGEGREDISGESVVGPVP